MNYFKYFDDYCRSEWAFHAKHGNEQAELALTQAM